MAKKNAAAKAPESSEPVWKGNDDLRPLLRPLEDIDPDPENLRLHSEEQVGNIEASFKSFGQAKPIVIWRSAPDARPITIAGNGTMRALKSLGWTHTAATEFRGTYAAARAFAFSDNAIPLQAEWVADIDVKLEQIQADFVMEIPDWSVEAVGFPVDEPEEETPRPNTKKADGKNTRERESSQTETGDDVDADSSGAAALQIKRGDVFKLGAHRLICGDSTSPETLAALMAGERAAFTHADPPYGLNKAGVANDDLHGDRLDAFQFAWWNACRPHIVNNGSAFVWGSAPDLWRFWYKHLAPAEGRETLSIRNEIVWDKSEGAGMCSDEMRSWACTTERAIFFMFGEQKLNIDAANFWPGFEPLRSALAGELERTGWTNKDLIQMIGHMSRHYFTRSQWTFPTEQAYNKLQTAAREAGLDAFQFEYSAIREIYERAKAEYDAEVKDAFYAGRPFFDNAHDTMGEVWSYPRVVGEERHGHSTPKPVAMIARVLKSCSPSGAIVLEPFIGSGSTLIAAEECGRRCYGIEIKPEYVATTLARYEKRTGVKAIKL